MKAWHSWKRWREFLILGTQMTCLRRTVIIYRQLMESVAQCEVSWGSCSVAAYGGGIIVEQYQYTKSSETDPGLVNDSAALSNALQIRYRRRLELSLGLGIFSWQALVLEIENILLGFKLQGFAIVELSIRESNECLADFCLSRSDVSFC